MKTPWHLWLIGVAALLWNAGGMSDFLLTQMRVSWYVGYFTPDQLDYFVNFPLWVNAAWGIATIGAFVGSVLLLMRSGWAVLVFAGSFLAMVVNLIYNFFISDVSMVDLMGQGALIFTLIVIVVGFLLILYSRAMRQRAVLR